MFNGRLAIWIDCGVAGIRKLFQDAQRKQEEWR